MRNFSRGFLKATVLAAAFFLMSCAGQPSRKPAEFDTAVRLLADNLVKQFNESQLFVGRLQEAKIVAAPFVDASSGEENAVSREVERILFEEIGKKSTKLTPLSISRINQTNFQESGYVMIGAFSLESYGSEGAKGEKKYHIYASIIDRSSRKIIANADLWIANSDLNYKPTALYENSPMYPRDGRLQSHVAIARSPAGTLADKEYYDSLETNALLIEADTLFDARDYEKSLDLFSQAAGRSDGQVMKTYIGMYRANVKLGRMGAAEDAFFKLVGVGVSNNNLSAKFLFSVDSTEFLSDRDMKDQYTLWVRQIGKYFSTSDRCLNIVGHSSHTGSAEYNDRLSLSRARRIQEQMRPTFPSVMQRSKAYGMGYKENIVGMGTDDARDSLDRRVEFAVADCQ
jgi:outer membrane protein OmpA-like peptidoglycan-associated protein